jgi:hypothetical protein
VPLVFQPSIPDIDGLRLEHHREFTIGKALSHEAKSWVRHIEHHPGLQSIERNGTCGSHQFAQPVTTVYRLCSRS